FGDKYRKIRNTIRYLLSNIDDFDPSKHRVGAPAQSLDAWMNRALSTFVEQALEAYDAYKFHVAFRLIHDFCTVQISSVYGNAMKDRLYCEKPDSEVRRRAQTVMYDSLVALTKLLAPMCVFTADEAWEFLKHKPANESSLDSVHLTLMPTVHESKSSADFDSLMKLRDDALLQLDNLKKSAGLNKALDAEVIYSVPDEAARASLAKFGVDLEDIVGCGFHSIVIDPTSKSVSVTIVDRRETYPACARSWKRRPDVGAVAEFKDLCQRDADAVRSARG
ncbi:MAG TPA: class I tRNA ligase family protein, partial [Tepidisphaeraceae bacterium]|nr:class I tRNA ligase family protein [Tepidisphaeraceae bacterium]